LFRRRRLRRHSKVTRRPQQFGRCLAGPCCHSVQPTALVGIADGPVARVGIAVALVGSLLPRVSEVVSLVGGLVALVGAVVALVSGPLAGVGGVLDPVQGHGPLSQPGLGRLQRLLSLPGPRLSRPDPSVKVRFARLIQRPIRDLGGPTARAACGGNLSLSWLPPRVVPLERRAGSHRRQRRA